jgi:hypothetical protein
MKNLWIHICLNNRYKWVQIIFVNYTVTNMKERIVAPRRFKPCMQSVQ